MISVSPCMCGLVLLAVAAAIRPGGFQPACVPRERSELSADLELESVRQQPDAAHRFPAQPFPAILFGTAHSFRLTRRMAGECKAVELRSQYPGRESSRPGTARSRSKTGRSTGLRHFCDRGARASLRETQRALDFARRQAEPAVFASATTTAPSNSSPGRPAASGCWWERSAPTPAAPRPSPTFSYWIPSP